MVAQNKETSQYHKGSSSDWEINILST